MRSVIEGARVFDGDTVPGYRSLIIEDGRVVAVDRHHRIVGVRIDGKRCVDTQAA